MSVMRSLPIFINSATFSAFCKAKNISQDRFAVDVIPGFFLFIYFFC
jgi:hypothetical protein